MGQHVRYVCRGDETYTSAPYSHSAGDTVTLNLSLRGKDRVRTRKADTQEALDGSVYTTLHYGRWGWELETGPMNQAGFALMREFLTSVEDGQVFGWDPDHDAAPSPLAYRNVVLDGTTWTEQRYATGTSQSTHYFGYKFRLREVP